MPSEYYCHNICPDKGSEQCPLPSLQQRLGATIHFASLWIAYAASATQGVESFKAAISERQEFRNKQKERGHRIIACIQAHEIAEATPPATDL